MSPIQEKKKKQKTLFVLMEFNFGEGNVNPLQYCCLENNMDGGAWWATHLMGSQSQTRLSD